MLHAFLGDNLAPNQVPKQASKVRLWHRFRHIAVGSLLTGSALFFVSATVVNIGNYAFNLILGRWLGPALFSEVNLIITLMLIVALITATLQTTIAKFTAAHGADEDDAAIASTRTWFGRLAWAFGIVVAFGLIFGSAFLRDFFHTESVSGHL